MKGFAILGLLMPGAAAGQEQSAADLIKFLTSPRPLDDRVPAFGQFTCGSLAGDPEENQKDVAAGAALAELGEAAVPDLERALDATGRTAGRSPWMLFHAYARVKGPEAVPRLREMMKKPDLNSLQYALADSIALSLGLSSYVSGPGTIVSAFCRFPTPRDALNDFILASEKKQAGRGAAVGYRFEVANSWSAPDETLDDERYSSAVPVDLVNPEFMTNFKTASGADCGRQLVKFTGGWKKNGINPYKVDNSDRKNLLRLIANCAAAK